KRTHRMNVLGSPSPLHPPSLNTGTLTETTNNTLSDPEMKISPSLPELMVPLYPIVEEDGQVFFSLDDGATKFTDLIHLVEFYQLNRGVLPCKLKHPCTAKFRQQLGQIEEVAEGEMSRALIVQFLSERFRNISKPLCGSQQHHRTPTINECAPEPAAAPQDSEEEEEYYFIDS
ncbi:hypothetical protein XENOCAPTIV_029669, partial [Xenoophorus captivus]